MAVVGQVIAKFVSEGLSSQAIDTGAPETFLGSPVDQRTFEAVIVWMLDENIAMRRQRDRMVAARSAIAAGASVADAGWVGFYS